MSWEVWGLSLDKIMKRFLCWWILNYLIGYSETNTLSKRQKLVAYKDAYMIENLKEILQNKVRSCKESLVKNGIEENVYWFYRGRIEAYQTLMGNMESSHKEWIKLTKT